MGPVEGQMSALDRAAGLAAFIVDNWGPLRADFRRFYGLDLAEAVGGGPDGWGLGLRDLQDLIAGLPPESAVAARHGWHWTQRDEMAAALVEIAHQNAWATGAIMRASYAAIRRRPPRPQKPLRVPRPIDQSRRGVKARSVADVIAMFTAAGALKDGGG